MKKLNTTQEKVLAAFKALFSKSGKCPSNLTISKKARTGVETTRLALWSLARMKLIGVNRKAKHGKFTY